MIARFDLTGIDEVKEAQPHFAHTPLAHLSYLKPDHVYAYWLDAIAEDLGDECSVAFVSRNSERIDGLAVYTDSAWDTKTVGRRVALINHLAGVVDSTRGSEILRAVVGEVLQHAARRGTDCLTYRVQVLDCTAIHALECHGFRLMDTLLNFLFDSLRTPLESITVQKQPNGLHIRLAAQEDLPEVLALTEKTFATYFGRYYSDPKMPPGTGTKVYDQWVRSSFEGWADWILVAEIDDRIAGYTMGKKPSVLELNHSLDIAHCNFGGIHPDFFGLGLYTALKLDAMRIARNFATHFDQLTHVSNYPVHRAILGLGWKITGARRSFHKWLLK